MNDGGTGGIGNHDGENRWVWLSCSEGAWVVRGLQGGIASHRRWLMGQPDRHSKAVTHTGRRVEKFAQFSCDFAHVFGSNQSPPMFFAIQSLTALRPAAKSLPAQALRAE